MLYIAWALFFIFLLFFLFILAFRIRRRYGFIAMIIFLLVVGFLASRTEVKKVEPGAAPASARLIADSMILGGSVQEMIITLEDEYLADINLIVTYGKQSGSGLNTPITAFVSPQGWQVGTAWTTKTVSIYPDGFGATFKYRVQGIVEWKIPFFTVVTQNKEYRGSAMVRLKNKMDDVSPR